MQLNLPHILILWTGYTFRTDFLFLILQETPSSSRQCERPNGCSSVVALGTQDWRAHRSLILLGENPGLHQEAKQTAGHEPPDRAGPQAAPADQDLTGEPRRPVLQAQRPELLYKALASDWTSGLSLLHICKLG